MCSAQRLRGPSYTEEELNVVREAVAAGKHISEIEDMLRNDRRPNPSVITAIHSAGLGSQRKLKELSTRQPRRAWGEEEIALARDLQAKSFILQQTDCSKT